MPHLTTTVGTLLAALALTAASAEAAPPRRCLLDLELAGVEFSETQVADGRELVGASAEETLARFARLDPLHQEVLIHGLAQQARGRGIRDLAGLLTEIADQGGSDLTLYEVRVRKFPRARIFRVSMGLGDNEFGGMIEVLGEVELPGGGRRALLEVVSRINDGDTYDCAWPYLLR